MSVGRKNRKCLESALSSVGLAMFIMSREHEISLNEESFLSFHLCVLTREFDLVPNLLTP